MVHFDWKQLAKYRAAQDLKERSRIGTFFYIILWSLILLFSRYDRQNPVFAYGILIAFILICIMRLVHMRNYQRLLDQHPRMNLILLSTTVLLSAAIWGVVFGRLMVQNTGFELKAMIIMTTAGLCSGGISTYIPSQMLSYLYTVLLLLPAALIIFFYHGIGTATGVLTTIYMLYMLALAKKGSEEYWIALNNEIKLAEKSEKLERISEIDGLTALYNRRCFDKMFEREWYRATRSGNVLAMAMLDIDWFKKINDTHGHLAGDECLKAVARECKKTFKRQTDIVARYGGEEFIFLITDTDITVFQTIAEKLRRNIENLVVQYGEADIRLTASIGISGCIPEFGHNRELLIDKADQALYAAKNSGRNRLVVLLASS
jgi:diguanylate cyclase (GGDEF)-like protein